MWLFWLIITAIIWTIVRMIVYDAFRAHQTRAEVFRKRLYQPHNTGFPPMAQNNRRNTLVDISGEIYGETEKAYRFYDGKEAVWLPKSQVEWYEDEKHMTMPEWLAMEKGLI